MSLLTIAPVPRATYSGAVPLGRAIAFFPVVGLILGAFVAGADALLVRWLPVTVASVVDLALLAILSGGLHLDGLADAADGLGAGGTSTERLAIMRDGRIGAFGASALALVLLLELAALAELDPRVRATAIACAVMVSRWSATLAIRGHRPARAEGLAVAITRDARRGDALFAALVTGVVAGSLLASPLPMLATAFAVAIVVAGVATRRLGGLTGDVYGAIAEIVFAGALVTQTARAV